MPQASSQPDDPAPLRPSGGRRRCRAPPGRPGQPGPVRLQINLLLGDKVVEGPPFEIGAGELAALLELRTPPDTPSGAPSVSLLEGSSAKTGPAMLPAPGAGDPAGAGRGAPHRYSLCRGRACWVLHFQDGSAQLKHEVGLAYVAYLLAHYDQAVPSAELFSKCSTGHRKNSRAAELPNPKTGLSEPITDGVASTQVPLNRDEAEARRRHEAAARAYKAAADNRSLPKDQREEARRRHAELRAFLKKHYGPAPNPGATVTKLVHRAIRRLCDHLRAPLPGEPEPSPVAVAFAEYVEARILVPSCRYTKARRGANVRLARGELSGRLIFECPPGDHWSVKL